MMAQLIVYANGLILTGYEINGFKTLAGLTTEFLQRAISTLDGHLSLTAPLAPAVAMSVFGNWYRPLVENAVSPRGATYALGCLWVGRGADPKRLRKVMARMLDRRFTMYVDGKPTLLDWWRHRC